MEKLKKDVKINISTKEACLIEVDVEFSSSAITEAIDQMVKEYSKEANLPGFRQGKAPKSIIKKKYIESLKAETVQNLTRIAFETISKKNETYLLTFAITGPEPIIEDDKPCKFKCTANVAPKFDLPKFKGLKFKKTAVEVAKKDIDAEIDQVREMYAEFATVDGASESGDMLKISYSSNIEAIEGNASFNRMIAAEDTYCWLSDPEMIPGFIKALTGTKPGDAKEIDVEFPEDFSEELLRSKKGKYQVTVIEIQRRLPITSDEELCKKINMPDIKELRENIKANLSQRKEQANTTEAYEKLMTEVCDSVGKLDLPPDLLAQEANLELRNMANTKVKTQEDADEFQKNIKENEKVANKTATKQLTRWLICSQIAKDQEITVVESDFDQAMSSISSSYGMSLSDVKERLSENGGMEQLQMNILISKVTEMIYNNADVSEKSSSSKDKQKESK